MWKVLIQVDGKRILLIGYWKSNWRAMKQAFHYDNLKGIKAWLEENEEISNLKEATH